MSQVPETIPELIDILPKSVNAKKIGDVNDILPDICTVKTRITNERDALDDKVIDLERKVYNLEYYFT